MGLCVKRLLSSLFLLFAGVLFVYGSGGATGKNRLGPVAVASIRNGITTKGEVRALLGKPQEIQMQVPVRQPPGAAPLPAKYAASEIWELSATGTTATAKKLRYFIVVYFDERGVVLDCQTETCDS